MTEALRARHRAPQITRLGRDGQDQRGIDGWEPMTPDGIVFQATLQKDRLIAKLQEDLSKFDRWEDAAERSSFIFAMGVRRDASLQAEIMAVTVERLEQGKCPVEPLFWDDLQYLVPTDVLARFYPEYVPAEDGAEPEISTGLLALGWDVIVEARLVKQHQREWVFDVDLGNCVLGGLAELCRFTDEFTSDPPEHSDTIVEPILSKMFRLGDTEPKIKVDMTKVRAPMNWVAFEGLGTARLISEPPVLEGRRLTLTLEKRIPRSNPHECADIELTEDWDIRPDLRFISGVPASIQKLRIAMGMVFGSALTDVRGGVRCRDFLKAGVPRDMLPRVVALEVARLANVPTNPDQGPRLAFIERVGPVEIPSQELNKNGLLPATIRADLHQHGEWFGPIEIAIKDYEPKA